MKKTTEKASNINETPLGGVKEREEGKDTIASIRLTDNILRDFTCAICTQYFRVPVSLPCGTYYEARSRS